MSELTAMPSFHCMSTNWNQGAHNIPGVSMLRPWFQMETFTRCSRDSFWHTWLMLSVVCNSCCERTAAPCSLHSLCTTWRLPLDHLLPSSSSFDTRSSPEKLLFPAVLRVQFLKPFETLHCYNLLTCWQNSQAKQRKAKQLDKYLKVNRRNLIMFCSSSCWSVTPALWKDCPNKEIKKINK